MLIGYARVSTIDQNPQLQIDDLKEAGCERIFVEHASGGSKTRPKLNQALEFLRPGDTLVVWKLSRLARSVAHVIQVADLLTEQDMDLKVLKQNFDTRSPEGKLLFHLIASFDEFQKELIRENTMAGIRAAKRAGRVGGRKCVTKEELLMTEAMLKDTVNYKFVSDVVKAAPINKTALYKYFPKEKIAELRSDT